MAAAGDWRLCDPHGVELGEVVEMVLDDLVALARCIPKSGHIDNANFTTALFDESILLQDLGRS